MAQDALFVSDTCAHCHHVLKLISDGGPVIKSGVAIRNIDHDPAARAEIRSKGITAVPVMVMYEKGLYSWYQGSHDILRALTRKYGRPDIVVGPLPPPDLPE